MKTPSDKIPDPKQQLLQAASSGRVNLLEDLLQDGISAASVDENQRNVLHRIAAIKKDHQTEVPAMMDAVMAYRERDGLDIDAQDNKLQTALHLAVINKNIQMVDHLIALGADLNAQDNKGNTALHYAANAEREDILDKLLNAGANPDIKNHDGKRPDEEGPPPKTLQLKIREARKWRTESAERAR